MIIREIQRPGLGAAEPGIRYAVTEKGLRLKDDLVTVTDEAALNFCVREGRVGLCAARFKADIIVDALEAFPAGTRVQMGTVLLETTGRRKRCHPGCSLDPRQCQINGRLLFLRVIRAGSIRLGDSLHLVTNPIAK